MLFMCANGGYLAWCWSASTSRHDFFRTFQITSGVFLLMYIVGHMDSVFVYARRLFLGIPTDWKFTTGAPAACSAMRGTPAYCRTMRSEHSSRWRTR